VEDFPAIRALGACMQVGGERLNSKDESDDYPRDAERVKA
jgi:hypothetical protein